jgi:hypothetical protein
VARQPLHIAALLIGRDQQRQLPTCMGSGLQSRNEARNLAGRRVVLEKHNSAYLAAPDSREEARARRRALHPDK